MGDIPQVRLGMAGGVGARADHAHLAPQHVEEVGQLVEAGAAQEAPQRRDAVMLHPVLVRAVVRVRGRLGHGAELPDAEQLAVPAEPLLPEEDGAGIEPGVRHEQKGREAGDERQRHQRQSRVEDGFVDAEARRPVGRPVIGERVAESLAPLEEGGDGQADLTRHDNLPEHNKHFFNIPV